MKNNIHSVYRKIIYFISIFLFSFTLHAQFTPARGTFVVTPPYPNKLSDYGNPNLLKMSATITATDPSFTSKAIRLKLSIFYNQQLLMQGNDMVVGERPMYLTMGQMLVLTQADLAPYFQQQNMRVSPVQYSQSLREGFYQFQLDILDYYTLQKIGLPLVASIYIMRYDPPLLYKPENKSVLMDKGQGLVQFQWNPRQIAPNTEYEFTIVELQQEKFVDPMIEFTARREGSYYYKTTTRMNTLNYGMMGELPLRWGKCYAWQVRAMTREGIDQVGTYEQDGYTDIRWFTYQKYCPTPTNIEVDVKNSTEATYTWDAAPEHTSYILKITAADNPEHRWLSVYPQEAKFEETQYRPDITYFYKLQGVCGEGVTSEESGERSFTMLPKGQIKNYKCNEGDGTESTGFETIANQKLLERDLQVGDTFTYSNWCKIKVTTVEKVGGYYKGKGVTRFPLAMFGFPLINIKFDSITVNTDMVALSGGFEAINKGIDGVADVDEAINAVTNIVGQFTGGANTGNANTNAVAPEYKVDFVISGDNPTTSFKPNATTTEQASSSNTSAGGTISFGGGKKVEVAETPTSIEDKDGKIYAVDEQGKVTKAAEKTKETESLAGNMSTREKTTTEGKVAFSAYKNQSYAFDAYNPQYTNASEYANKYEEFGGEKVAVKAIAPGKPDKVSIQFDGDVPVDSIYFLTPAGVRYRAEKDNGGYYLNLIGGEANEIQEVYAMLRNRQDTTKPMTIGKLIVAAYPRQEKNLILVPVNGAKVDTAGVVKKINEIYNPVNVYWTIKIAENFENKTWDIDGDDALNVTGSKWYTTYTEEMKALKTAYSQANNIDQRTLYMFVTKKAKTDNETSSKTIVGDMPRGKQFGFLFTEKADPATLAKTIAHELGHGYFQLKHPFEMGLTQNDLPTHLMDYGGGTEFNKYEWDLMHDPGIVTGLFESDTSGMWASKLGHYIHQRANEEGVQWLYSNVINKANIFSQDTKVDSFSINDVFQRSNDLLKQIENQNIDIKKRVKLLNEGTEFADSDMFQTGAYSYRHAMRNKKQNIDEAKHQADAFVREEYQKAINFKQQNLLDSAYFHLGIAIHVLQDATSPSHYGFKEWDDYPKLHPVVIIHALQEVSYPGFNSNLQQITNLYLELFENNRPLPNSNLFNNIQHD